MAERTSLPPELGARVDALSKAQSRVLLGITGPPGAGKSTLAQAVVGEMTSAVYLPMDGFHLADVELTGLSRLDRKGTRLIVTEGNYLLDDQPPWPAVRALLSQVWYLEVDVLECRRRLVARHEQFGKSPEDAQAWVRTVDEPNATQIERVRGRADVIIASD